MVEPEIENEESQNPHREWLTQHHDQLLQQYESQEISRVEYLKRLVDDDEEKEHRADHDGLLPDFFNRSGFTTALNLELAEIRRMHLPGVILILDVDRLKETNDTMGHLAGDFLLIVYSQIMEVCTRESDHKGRWGGDEFGIFLPASDVKNGAIIAERIRAMIEETLPIIFTDLPWQQSISIGLTEVKDDDTPETLIHRADEAMYEAKQVRNKVVVK